MTFSLPPGPPQGTAFRWSREKGWLLVWDPQDGVWHAVSATQPGLPRAWRHAATAALVAAKMGLELEAAARLAAFSDDPETRDDDFESDEDRAE